MVIIVIIPVSCLFMRIHRIMTKLRGTSNELWATKTLQMSQESLIFHTIDRQVFLKKLKLYRVSDKALVWFKSYMEDRWQFVELNGQKSKEKKIDVGCFQGSTAALLLFIIFINELVVL